MTLNSFLAIAVAICLVFQLLIFIWAQATGHRRFAIFTGILFIISCVALFFAPAEGATLPNVPAPAGQVCSIRTVCKPLHPKPRVVHTVQRLDLMCYQFVVTITLAPLEAIPLTLNLPPDTVLPPDDAPPVPTATPAVYTVYEDGPGAVGAWGWPGDAPRPVTASYGSPGRLSAPEIDPNGVLAGAALLAGVLAVLVGRRS